VIRFLISKNPDLRTKKTRWGQLPLHLFCRNMMLQDVESQETVDAMLLDCPETLWVEDERGGGSALKLCRGSSNLRDMLRNNIIQYAREFKSKGKHEDFVNLFKASCFDIPSLQLFNDEWPELLLSDLKDGARPLHIACMRYDQDKDHDVRHIKYLIKEAPAALALQDSSGSTPLHIILKSKGLPAYAQSQRLRLYPLFIRQHLMQQHDGLVKLILEANTEAFMICDNKGFTPLLVLAQNDWPLTVIYSMLRTDPERILANHRFPGSQFGATCTDRKRKREN
jgi:hypothetical protein